MASTALQNESADLNSATGNLVYQFITGFFEKINGITEQKPVLVRTNGLLLNQNDTKAAALYQKACDVDSALACFNLASMYLTGEGVKTDARKSVSLFQQACDLNDAGACYTLGNMYREGVGVKRSRTKADELFWKACKDGLKEACGAVE